MDTNYMTDGQKTCSKGIDLLINFVLCTNRMFICVL